MPARHVRYRMDNTSFGEMMMSDQTSDFAHEAAQEIAHLATQTQRLSTGVYDVDMAVPPVVLDGNPRRVAHVVGNDPLHAVEEFGSGIEADGQSAGQPRPQKGYSEPRRNLGRAAARIIPPATRRPS